ncbi:MAG: hypothetical protein J2P34_10565 [Actinobacteria bacterium]|nr:hypothetical protein [Actinomycetota bacterium]
MSRVDAAWSRLGRHGPFTVALLAGLAARILTMIGFPPAIWFGGDSASYLATALRLDPATSRLSGYGVMLAILRPLHSFAAVTALQHLMGLGIAVMIYALLRRYGLPGWGATLATLPVLLDAYELQLEHQILPSVAFGFLVMAAVTLTLWWREDRPPWATVTAGALLAIAATLWPVGLPLLIVFLIYLLVRRAGWRRIGATVAAGVVPLALYGLWFDGFHHSVGFTYSDGIYLWSRTMSFADCSVIRPPANEAVLCPHQPVAGRPSAGSFIWVNSPLDRLPGPKFTPHNNSLARNFAIRAIEAQPGAYVATVAHDVGMSFSWNRPTYPSVQVNHRYDFSYATTHWIAPDFPTGHGHTVASDQLTYGGVTSTRAVAPFAAWLRGYQRVVYLRGTLLGIILLIGLAGIVRSWLRGGIRRVAGRGDGWGGPGLFPWAAAVTLLVVPVMTADFGMRYVQISIPVTCLAAALAFARRDAVAPTAPAGEPAAVTATAPAETASQPGPPAAAAGAEPAGGEGQSHR